MRHMTGMQCRISNRRRGTEQPAQEHDRPWIEIGNHRFQVRRTISELGQDRFVIGQPEAAMVEPDQPVL
ncbi:MAG TPA: hypothetical protein QGF05_11420, partial [Dehalococcoidia bacterium]|nr:hypothetical protein [Dehalococcoidia bacterium]